MLSIPYVQQSYEERAEEQKSVNPAQSARLLIQALLSESVQNYTSPLNYKSTSSF